MLSAEQQDSLLVALFSTAELMGHQLSSSAAQMMVQDLIAFTESEVTAALQACRRELNGKLTLAAILQRVHAEDGRPGRDEAWAIAIQADDERDTVVLTGEIMAALQVARPILEARDKIGARMAFLGAYDRLIAQARQDAQPVKWEVSLGFDPELRARAIKQARDLGRLPAPEADRLLLQHAQQAPSANGMAIAGLITGTVSKPDPQTREKLRAISDELKGRRRRKDIQARWDARQERIALAQRKAETAAAIAEQEAH
jgi:hypothetical protein